MMYYFSHSPGAFITILSPFAWVTSLSQKLHPGSHQSAKVTISALVHPRKKNCTSKHASAPHAFGFPSQWSSSVSLRSPHTKGSSWYRQKTASYGTEKYILQTWWSRRQEQWEGGKLECLFQGCGKRFWKRKKETTLKSLLLFWNWSKRACW